MIGLLSTHAIGRLNTWGHVTGPLLFTSQRMALKGDSWVVGTKAKGVSGSLPADIWHEAGPDGSQQSVFESVLLLICGAGAGAIPAQQHWPLQFVSVETTARAGWASRATINARLIIRAKRSGRIWE